jgi:hypothetical protein
MIEEDQVYIVVDIEGDGPAPGLHSMLSLAAIATTPDHEVSRFYRKLLPLEGASPDVNTTAWWKSQPEAWAEVTKDREDPADVIKAFCDWLDSLGADPIFAASPIGLDYTFVSWYLFRFVGRNPFMNEKNAIRTLDIRSYIAGKFGYSFNDSSRAKLPAELTNGMQAHTHRAIDDAAGYAFLLRKLINDRPAPTRKR